MKILSEEEYGKAIKEADSVLICESGESRYFDDNIIGRCDRCGCQIYYRPYNRNAANKICIECASKL